MSVPITIFACLKPFKGDADLIQRNAIASWKRLSPPPTILLFGGDDETPRVCEEELGVRYVHGIARNRWGTPVLSDIFATAQCLSSSAILSYVNADNILMDDYMQAIAMVAARHRRFLLIGQRLDLDVTTPLPFDRSDWQAGLRAEAAARGHLHGGWGIDYRVFPRGLLDPVPAFAVGRAAYDNWVIYRARQLKVPVIDITPTAMVIHQNHDYGHHPQGWKGIRESEEADENLRLAGGHQCLFNVDDRTHFLTPEGLRRDLSVAQLKRRWNRLPVLVRPQARLPLELLRKGVDVSRPLWRPVLNRVSRP